MHGMHHHAVHAWLSTVAITAHKQIYSSSLPACMVFEESSKMYYKYWQRLCNENEDLPI